MEFLRLLLGLLIIVGNIYIILSWKFILLTLTKGEVREFFEIIFNVTGRFFGGLVFHGVLGLIILIAYSIGKNFI